ncbi:MAG: phosphoribosyltransferase [Actinomycetota bacterium]
MRYQDRTDAGRRLASELTRRSFTRPIVLALPRGGVPVAREVARVLEAPMEIFVARKVGAPAQPEFGIGAIAEGGVRVIDHRTVALLGLTEAGLQALVEVEERELNRRVTGYRGGRPIPDLGGRDVILVDDGLATGVTAEAALVALKQHHPLRLILAVPVCAPQTRDRLADMADEVFCAVAPDSFAAVGLWYDDFSQVTDEQVAELVRGASSPGHNTG